MVYRPASPRISPLAPDERDEQVRELLGGAGSLADSVGGQALDIFATLARHPGLFRRWLPFGGELLAGKLPDRDRELLILRTAWRCRSDYEWIQHQSIARDAGVTAAEIERLRLADAPDAPGWAAFDATLVRAADELHDEGCLSDATWAALAGRYDERQLIELPMLVGHYHLLAFTLSSLGVQLESDDSGAAG